MGLNLKLQLSQLKLRFFLSVYKTSRIKKLEILNLNQPSDVAYTTTMIQVKQCCRLTFIFLPHYNKIVFHHGSKTRQDRHTGRL